jgi:hypothetical protein
MISAEQLRGISSTDPLLYLKHDSSLQEVMKSLIRVPEISASSSMSEATDDDLLLTGQFASSSNGI